MTGASGTAPHLVLLLRHPLYLRNYESTIRALAKRRWHITLATMEGSRRVDDSLMRRLASDYRDVDLVTLPRASGLLQSGSDTAFVAVDWLRFLDARYTGAPALAERAERRVPRLVHAGLAAYGVERSTRRRLAAFTRLTRAGDAGPVSGVARRALADLSPTVLAVTPMVDIDGGQQAYVQAARSLGIPSAALIASWDNLAIKGLIHRMPDRVMVWNEMQADDAVRGHRVPRERVTVTGAQVFDWLRHPALLPDRTTFLESLGLDPQRPLVLYAGSSSVVGEPEWRFLSDAFLPALRRYWDRTVANSNVVIRPHPTSPEIPAAIADALTGLGAVLDPRAKAPVTDDPTRSHYRALLTYADAVVGVNTSAFLEAAVCGTRPVALASRRIATSQQDAPHFAMLLEAGLFHEPRSVYGALADIAEAVADPSLATEQLAPFVRRFVDPPDEQSRATDVLVEAIEKLPQVSVEPVRSRFAPLAWSLLILLGLARVSQRLAARVIARLRGQGNAADLAPAPAPALSPGEVPAPPRRKPTVDPARRRRERHRQKTVLAFKIDIYRSVRGPDRVGSVRRIVRRGRKITLARLARVPGIGAPPIEGGKPAAVGSRIVHSTVSRPLLARRGTRATEGRMGRLRADLRRAQAEGRPVAFGPWTSEVGFELLYWAPFVQRLVAQADLDEELVTLISRGGTRAWYGLPRASYRDAFEVLGSRDYYQRIGSVGRGRKQTRWTEAEQELAQALAPQDAFIVHPSQMYLAFMPYFAGRVPQEWLRRYLPTDPAPLGGMSPTGVDEPDRAWNAVSNRLPGRYLALALYHRPSFSATMADPRLATLLSSAAETGLPLVSVETGLVLDDHRPVDLGRRWVSRPLRGVDPAINLSLQQRVIAGSSGLIATYGGTSYLGGLLQRPTLAVYDDPARILWHHLDVARDRFGTTSDTYVVADLSTLDASSAMDLFDRGPLAATAEEVVA